MSTVSQELHTILWPGDWGDSPGGEYMRVVTIMKRRPSGSRGLRMTRQRRAILELVRETGSHPTADEVYRRVRRRMPHISLGTVYRNLEVLSERGLVKRLGQASSQRRFDGRVEEHYHVRCLRCGRVEDISVKPGIPAASAVRGASNYEIVGHRLEWVGFCPKCSRERSELDEEGPGKGREER